MALYGKKYYEDWDKEIEEYKNSGLPITVFCRNKNYTYAAFSYHYYKKKKNKQSDGSEFLPVVCVSDPDPVICVNGLKITITDRTDSEALKKVLQAIRGIL